MTIEVDFSKKVYVLVGAFLNDNGGIEVDIRAYDNEDDATEAYYEVEAEYESLDEMPAAVNVGLYEVMVE